jgi:RNA polymerase sigma-70 factor (ECF subfamily)
LQQILSKGALKEMDEHLDRIMDEAAYELLFRSNFKGLCFFAQKYVKDFETAKEIVQDAFVVLWEKRVGIDTDRSVKSYLTTTIYNKCHNYLRDNKKFNTEILSLENLIQLDGYEQADRLVEVELAAEIRKAINELPEKCRQIFVLSRDENLKYKEIADQMEISIKTVETQMSKALQHLRVRLAEYLSSLIVLLIFNRLG